MTRWVSAAGVLLVAGCAERDVPAPEKVGITWTADSIKLSVSLNLIAAEHELIEQSTLTDASFPQDMATSDNTGWLFVLDRLNQEVLALDHERQERWRAGRKGDGPGEFEDPYALARLGNLLAVWDRNQRITVFTTAGELASTFSVAGGDSPTLWQRFPISKWEEPLQLSREDPTRRLGSIGGDRVGLLLQEKDERFDTDFLESREPARFNYHLVAYDTAGDRPDTLATLPGQELGVASGGGGGRFAMTSERPFALRPLWTSGEGWVATAHGESPEVTVHLDSGAIRRVVWPRDDRPLGRGEWNSYIDHEIEAYKRVKGERSAREVAEMSRDFWIDRELAHWTERPQLMGMLGAEKCLALIPFRADEGPHGEALTALIVNLETEESVVVTLPRREGFIRHMSSEALFAIHVEEDGSRSIAELPLPDQLSCAPKV